MIGKSNAGGANSIEFSNVGYHSTSKGGLRVTQYASWSAKEDIKQGIIVVNLMFYDDYDYGKWGNISTTNNKVKLFIYTQKLTTWNPWAPAHPNTIRTHIYEVSDLKKGENVSFKFDASYTIYAQGYFIKIK